MQYDYIFFIYLEALKLVYFIISIIIHIIKYFYGYDFLLIIHVYDFVVLLWHDLESYWYVEIRKYFYLIWYMCIWFMRYDKLLYWDHEIVIENVCVSDELWDICVLRCELWTLQSHNCKSL